MLVAAVALDEYDERSRLGSCGVNCSECKPVMFELSLRSAVVPFRYSMAKNRWSFMVVGPVQLIW